METKIEKQVRQKAEAIARKYIHPMPNFGKAEQNAKREIASHKGGRIAVYPRARCTPDELKRFKELQEKYDASAADLITFMVNHFDLIETGLHITPIKLLPE